MLENTVVGDVVAGRLADPLVSLATKTENIDPELFFHFPCHRVNIVADQPDGAGGEDTDGLGFEES